MGIYNFKLGKHFENVKEMMDFLKGESKPTQKSKAVKKNNEKKTSDDKEEVIENG